MSLLRACLGSPPELLWSLSDPPILILWCQRTPLSPLSAEPTGKEGRQVCGKELWGRGECSSPKGSEISLPMSEDPRT